MQLRDLPRSYVGFLLLTVLGTPSVMLIDGDRVQLRGIALLFLALLLWALARGSVIVWALFLLWNLFTVLAVAVSAGGTLLLPNAVLLPLLGAGSLALLLSPSMLRHVGLRRSRSARHLS